MSVSISNAEGPKVTSSADLTEVIVITMRRDGVELPVSCELADTASRGLELDEGGGRNITILVEPRSVPGFQPGTYEFTVSLEKLLASLVLTDNTPWPGSAKVESRHQIVLRPVATADDRAAFDEQEANALVALRRPADAIPFVEELTRLRPESWYAWAFLGNTYRRANLLPQAIAAYERSRQGWLGVRSQRNDQIAFELAATYTLVGSEAQATMCCDATDGLRKRSARVWAGLARLGPNSDAKS